MKEIRERLSRMETFEIRASMPEKRSRPNRPERAARYEGEFPHGRGTQSDSSSRNIDRVSTDWEGADERPIDHGSSGHYVGAPKDANGKKIRAGSSKGLPPPPMPNISANNYGGSLIPDLPIAESSLLDECTEQMISPSEDILDLGAILGEAAITAGDAILGDEESKQAIANLAETLQLSENQKMILNEIFEAATDPDGLTGYFEKNPEHREITQAWVRETMEDIENLALDLIKEIQRNPLRAALLTGSRIVGETAAAFMTAGLGTLARTARVGTKAIATSGAVKGGIRQTARKAVTVTDFVDQADIAKLAKAHGLPESVVAKRYETAIDYYKNDLKLTRPDDLKKRLDQIDVARAVSKDQLRYIESVRGLTIDTPYGLTTQGTTARAIEARQKIAQNGRIYRRGTYSVQKLAQNGSRNNTKPYNWSPNNQGIEQSFTEYQNKFGMKGAKPALGGEFIEIAEIKPNARFITREAPAYDGNAGGKIEVVVNPKDIKVVGHMWIGDSTK